MKKTSLLAISIVVIAVGLITGYFVYAATQDNPWNGLSCEEQLDFSMSPEHQNLTMDQHMEFHSYYFDHCSETEST